ncbi:MAG: rhomboid family intramembrane serine protease [Candidatus Korobacteraceae bacterium]
MVSGVRRPPKWTEIPQYPVIAGTAALAIAVTIAWWFKVDISPLFATAMIRRGELWRLVTSILPHHDILHLGFNVYWFWIFGSVVERVYGHLKTAALIVLFALGSSAMEFAFALGGIGLSGVVYGLFGLLWVLSPRDERFHDVVDRRTVQLFVLWFAFCVFTTLAHILPVANIAHGAGAALGILVGFAITAPDRRTLAATGIAVILCVGLWGSTLGRPRINLSGKAGYQEGTWGYDALMANRNQEAVRWLEDAARYQPKEDIYWYDLGIAYERLDNKKAAQTAYQRAHQLKPDNTDYSKAWERSN